MEVFTDSVILIIYRVLDHLIHIHAILLKRNQNVIKMLLFNIYCMKMKCATGCEHFDLLFRNKQTTHLPHPPPGGKFPGDRAPPSSMEKK